MTEENIACRICQQEVPAIYASKDKVCPKCAFVALTNLHDIMKQQDTTLKHIILHYSAAVGTIGGLAPLLSEKERETITNIFIDWSRISTCGWERVGDEFKITAPKEPKKEN